MCVCVCVCANRVCVLCNPCVCLCAIRVCVCGRFFIVNYVVFWACLENCKGGHFIRVFTFKVTCSIRVCVCVLGVSPGPCFKGRTAHLTSAGRTANFRFGFSPNSLTQSEVFISSRQTDKQTDRRGAPGPKVFGHA